MSRTILPYSAAFDEAPAVHVPRHIRFAAIAFRSIFIVSLLLVTAWVSRPQLGSNWLDHFSLGDFVRVVLGVAACLWMLVNLFILPKDAHGYQTWARLGLALTLLIAVSFAVFL